MGKTFEDADTITDILAAWREAERRLGTLPTNSEKWRSAWTEVNSLRARYQGLSGPNLTNDIDPPGPSPRIARPPLATDRRR